ncbi:MAG: type II secretion system protein [Acidobacteria bacterium]|nr:type II secretion system protein [Acidobacteriota bacterium]
MQREGKHERGISSRGLFWVKSGAYGQAGLTLVELIVAVALLSLLSTIALPVARVQLKREKERKLHQSLREVRTAIDRYKEAADRGMIQVELGTEGYPPNLEILVEGVKLANSPEGKLLKLLRRIPQDPMTNSTEWGLRSYQDRPDSLSWGGQNVFDVYTRSQGEALDGTRYSEW